MRLVKDKFQFTVFSLQLKAVLFSFGLLMVLQSSAQSVKYPERPDPPRLVNDFAGMLSGGEARDLENKLVAYSDSTSTQIAIVTINSLEGMEKNQYATELAEKWGIGDKKKDNGVLILISKNDHQLYIATGRGVEEFLPDVTCNHIIENDLKPAFKAGHYYEGLNAATGEMMARLSGNFTGDDRPGNNQKGIPGWVIILIILVIIILSTFFRGGGGGGGTIGAGGWIAGSMLGGGFGGGGGGGSSDSGGFGGFGGGSFGGGGAGGSW